MPEPGSRASRRHHRPRRDHADRQRLPDVLGEPRRGRDRDADDPELRRVRPRGPHRGRGPRVRPERCMDAKMARRMSRFIHFAMAAGKEAVARLGHRLRGDEPGAARPRRRRRQHRRRRDRADHRRHARPRQQGPALRVARSRCRPCRARWAPHAVDGVRPDRSGHDPGRRLRDVGHRLPRRAPPHPDRRVRRRPGRRLRGARSGRWAWRRSANMARPVEAQRLARDGLAAVRRDPRRVRPRRGRRRRRRRVAGARPRARRDADRRDPRRRPDRRTRSTSAPRSRPAAARPGR